MKLYNQNFENINNLVNEGRVNLFLTSDVVTYLEAKHSAESYAKEHRSYVYKVLNHNRKLIGYGVPK